MRSRHFKPLGHRGFILNESQWPGNASLPAAHFLFFQLLVAFRCRKLVRDNFPFQPVCYLSVNTVKTILWPDDAFFFLMPPLLKAIDVDGDQWDKFGTQMETPTQVLKPCWNPAPLCCRACWLPSSTALSTKRWDGCALVRCIAFMSSLCHYRTSSPSHLFLPPQPSKKLSGDVSLDQCTFS